MEFDFEKGAGGVGGGILSRLVKLCFQTQAVEKNTQRSARSVDEGTETSGLRIIVKKRKTIYTKVESDPGLLNMLP